MSRFDLIRKIQIDYCHHDYTSRIPVISGLYHSGHVFDAEKSPEWNLNKVLEMNELLVKDRNQRYLEQKELDQKLHSDLKKVLIEEYNLNDMQSKRIIDLAWSELDKGIDPFIRKIEYLLDFCLFILLKEE